MDTLSKIRVDIELTEDGLEGLGRIKSQIDSAVNGFVEAGATIRQVGLDIQRVGVGFSTAISIPLGLLGKEASDAASTFELEMRRVSSLVKDLTDTEFKQMNAQVRELAVTMGVDAKEAAQALYEVISADIPKENAISFLETATKTAIAGLTTTEKAVNGLVAVIKSYHLEVSEASKVSDSMFAAVNVGKFTFEQLAAAIGKAAPLGHQLGVSYNEILAAGSTLSKQGFTVSEAMSRISYSMISLLKPTKQMEALFGEVNKKYGINISSGQELITHFHGLQGALEALNSTAEGNASVLAKATGRYQGLQAILGLTGDSAKDFAKDLKFINESAGETDRAFGEITKTFDFFKNQMKASFKDVLITIGEPLNTALRGIVKDIQPLFEKVKDLAKAFTELTPETQKWMVELGLIAVVAGPALIIVGKLVAEFGTFISLIGKAGAWGASFVGEAGGITGALTAMAPWITVVAGAFAAFKASEYLGEWTGLKETLEKVGAAIMELGSVAVKGLTAAFDLLVVAVMPFVAGIKAVWEIAQPFASTVLDVLIVGLQKLGDVFDAVSIFAKGFAQVLGTVFQGQIEATAGLFKEMAEVGIAAWNGLKKGMGDAVSYLLDLLKQFTGWVRSNFGGIWDGFLNTTRAVWEPVVNFIRDSVLAIGKWLSNLGGSFSKGIADWADGIIKKFPFIQQAWDALTGKTREATQKIAEDHKKMADANFASNAKMIDSMKSMVSAMKANWEAVASNAKSSQKDIDLAWAGFAEAQIRLNRAMKESVDPAMVAELGRITEKYREMKGPVAGVGQEYDNNTGKVKRLSFEEKAMAEQQIRDAKAIAKEWQNSWKEWDGLEKKLKKATEDQFKFGESYGQSYGAAWREADILMTKIDAAMGKAALLKGIPKDIQDMMKAAIPPTLEFSAAATAASKALKDVKFETSAMYEEKVNKARDAYSKIRDLSNEERAFLGVSTADQLRLWVNWQDARVAEAKRAGTQLTNEEMRQLDEAKKVLGEKTSLTNNAAASLTKLGREMQSILGSVSRDMADAIVKGQSLGTVMNKAFLSMKEAIIKFAINDGLKLLTKELGLANFSIEGVMKSIGKLFGGGGGDLAGAASRLAALTTQVGAQTAQVADTAVKSAAATTTAINTATKATTEAGTAAANVAKTGSDVAKTANTMVSTTTNAAKSAVSTLTSLMGPINMVSGLVSAVTGVLSYLGQRRMEQDIGRIEVTTRGVLNQLLSIQNDVNRYWPQLTNLVQLMRLESIENVLYTINDSTNNMLPMMEGVRDSVAGVNSTMQTVMQALEQMNSTLADGIQLNTDNINFQDLGLDIFFPVEEAQQFAGTINDLYFPTEEIKQFDASLETLVQVISTESLQAFVQGLAPLVEILPTLVEAVHLLRGAVDTAAQSINSDTNEVTGSSTALTTALTNIVPPIRTTTQEFNATGTEAAKTATSVSSAGSSFTSASSGATQLSGSLTSVSADSGKASTELKKVGDGAISISIYIRDFGKEMEKTATAIYQSIPGVVNSAVSFDKLGEAAQDTEPLVKIVIGGIGEVGTSAQGAAPPTQNLATTVTNLGNAANAAANGVMMTAEEVAAATEKINNVGKGIRDLGQAMASDQLANDLKAKIKNYESQIDYIHSLTAEEQQQLTYLLKQHEDGLKSAREALSQREAYLAMLIDAETAATPELRAAAKQHAEAYNSGAETVYGAAVNASQDLESAGATVGGAIQAMAGSVVQNLGTLGTQVESAVQSMSVPVEMMGAMVRRMEPMSGNLDYIFDATTDAIQNGTSSIGSALSSLGNTVAGSASAIGSGMGTPYAGIKPPMAYKPEEVETPQEAESKANTTTTANVTRPRNFTDGNEILQWMAQQQEEAAAAVSSGKETSAGGTTSKTSSSSRITVPAGPTASQSNRLEDLQEKAVDLRSQMASQAENNQHIAEMNDSIAKMKNYINSAMQAAMNDPKVKMLSADLERVSSMMEKNSAEMKETNFQLAKAVFAQMTGDKSGASVEDLQDKMDVLRKEGSDLQMVGETFTSQIQSMVNSIDPSIAEQKDALKFQVEQLAQLNKNVVDLDAIQKEYAQVLRSIVELQKEIAARTTTIDPNAPGAGTGEGTGGEEEFPTGGIDPLEGMPGGIAVPPIEESLSGGIPAWAQGGNTNQLWGQSLGGPPPNWAELQGAAYSGGMSPLEDLSGMQTEFLDKLDSQLADLTTTASTTLEQIPDALKGGQGLNLTVTVNNKDAEEVAQVIADRLKREGFF